MTIPGFLWFVLDVACVGGLLAWHKASPSRHQVMMMAGLGWMALMDLPWVFTELFGEDHPTESLAGRITRMVPYSGLFTWIGVAFFALGLGRLSKAALPGFRDAPVTHE